MTQNSISLREIISPALKKVHFCTLGCPKNAVDTEVMAQAVLKSGAVLTADPAEADLIAVNTCAFLEASKAESVEKILELAQFKNTGSCQKLVVTGCLASRHPQEVEASLPEVDHFLGTNDLHKIPLLLFDGDLPVNLISKPDFAQVPFEILEDRLADGPRFSRYLKISEGCDRTCTFCIIPQLRGPQRSRSIESLVREAQRLVAEGAREINLIAQDLTAYGHDLMPVKRLEDLLEALLREVSGLHWLRLHYVYPQRFSDRLLELLAQGLPLLPYLDMPLQHASSRILKLMRRGTNYEKQMQLLDKLRRRIPSLTLRTTLIVGFPSESETDFSELLDFLRRVQFDHVGVFQYSREAGTAAALLKGQVSDSVKETRWNQVMALQQEISKTRNQNRIGETLQVLVHGPSEESEFLLEGRAWHQAPEIDGLTYITGSDDSHRRLKAGEIVRVKITQAHHYDLAGEVVEC